MNPQKEEEVQKSRKKVKNYILCFDHLLGEGAVAKVYLTCLSSNPEQVYATKVINKNRCTNRLMQSKPTTISRPQLEDNSRFTRS